MAINARLLGLAQGPGMPLDLAGAVQPAIDKMERAALRERQLIAAEGKAFKEAMQEREAFSAKLISQYKDPEFKGVPSQGISWLTSKAAQIKQNVYNIAMDPSLGNLQKTLLINEQKESVNELKTWADQYKEAGENFLDQTDLLSSLNDSTLIKLNKMRQAGEFYLVEDKAVFEINGQTIIKEMKDLPNAFGLIEQDHKSYNDILEKLNTTAQKQAAKGEGMKAVTFEIDKAIEGLQLTDIQYATLAVDQLGYLADNEAGVLLKQLGVEAEDFKQYLSEDIADGKIVDDEKDEAGGVVLETLKKFVNDNLRLATTEHYNAYYKRSTEDPSETQQNKITVVNDATDLMTSIFNKMPTAIGGTQSPEVIDEMITIIKGEPIFSTEAITNPQTKKDLFLSIIKKELPNITDEEANTAFESKYPGNPMFFIGDIGILDINGLLNVYNEKLPSSRRMTNSEMKNILNNLTKDENINRDFSQ